MPANAGPSADVITAGVRASGSAAAVNAAIATSNPPRSETASRAAITAEWDHPGRNATTASATAVACVFVNWPSTATTSPTHGKRHRPLAAPGTRLARRSGLS